VSRLGWCFLGRVAYDDARRLQEDLAAERVAGTIGDRLLLLEHPPVVTLGRHAPDPFAAVARGDAPLPPVPVRVGRGGGATYHGPGQLVAYPVVALRSGGRGVRRFVAALEESLCEVARLSGVAAVRRAGLPGAWAPGESPRKLGSVGIGVRRGVTLHGAALNLARSSVDGFRGFDPCGLAGVVATSVEAELEALGPGAGALPGLETAAALWARSFARHAGFAQEFRIDHVPTRGFCARGDTAGRSTNEVTTWT